MDDKIKVTFRMTPDDAERLLSFLAESMASDFEDWEKEVNIISTVMNAVYSSLDNNKTKHREKED